MSLRYHVLTYPNRHGCLFRVGSDDRVGHRIDREGDPILHTHLAHELGYMRFHGPLFDAQRAGNLAVGSGGDQKLEHLGLTGRETERKPEPRDFDRPGRAIDKHGQHPPWRPDRPLTDGHDRLFDLLWRGAGFEICLCADADRLQDGLVVRIRAHDDQPDFGPQSMDGADQRQRELVTVQANQGQFELLIGQELRQFEDHELDPGMILKKRDKTLHADGLRFEQRYPQSGR